MRNADMPAMPLPLGNETTEGNQGLTKREHFAAMAMQGLLSNASTGVPELWEDLQQWLRQMSECSVEFADSLLAELEKNNEQN